MNVIRLLVGPVFKIIETIENCSYFCFLFEEKLIFEFFNSEINYKTVFIYVFLNVFLIRVKQPFYDLINQIFSFFIRWLYKYINEYNYEDVLTHMELHELHLLFLQNKNCRNLFLLTSINIPNECSKFMISDFCSRIYN